MSGSTNEDISVKLAAHGNEGKKRDLHIAAHSYLEDNPEGLLLGGGQSSIQQPMMAVTINFENPCYFGRDSKDPSDREN